jgi:cytidylate kinase
VTIIMLPFRNRSSLTAELRRQLLGRRFQMPIVSISRGSYSKGKEIAEALAARLGYECVSRDFLLNASEDFNIPEVKLVRALHDSPSVLERFTYGKERYIAFIRSTLLEHLKKDNVVYHGLAGHFFLKGISHVMKVRIIANVENRIKEEMRRENISEQKARYILQKDDDERRKWALYLYGIDTWDPKLYDLVLHVDTLAISDIVDILAHGIERPCFKPTKESKAVMQDLCLAAKAEALLVDKFPTVKVVSKDGLVYVTVKSLSSKKTKVYEEVNSVLSGIEGFKEVKAEIEPIIVPD